MSSHRYNSRLPKLEDAALPELTCVLTNNREYYYMTATGEDDCTSTDSEQTKCGSRLEDVRLDHTGQCLKFSDQDYLSEEQENWNTGLCETDECRCDSKFPNSVNLCENQNSADRIELCECSSSSDSMCDEAGGSQSGTPNSDAYQVQETSESCNSEDDIHEMEQKCFAKRCFAQSTDEMSGNSLPLPDLILRQEQNNDSLSDEDDPSTDSLDAEDMICHRKTRGQTCSDQESDILSTWDPYQSVYMSISDDASEEKLDASCLQTDWQPYQDDDGDYDLFPLDNLIGSNTNKNRAFRRDDTVDGVGLESDSESEDLDDVISETRNARKFIVSTFEKLRKIQHENLLKNLSRHEMDQRNWKRFLRNALATCSTSIGSLSDVLEALQNSTSLNGVIKNPAKHFKSSHRLECVKDLLLEMEKLVTILTEYQPPSLEAKKQILVPINMGESHMTHEAETSQVKTSEPMTVILNQLNDNLSDETFLQYSGTGIDSVKTSSETLAVENLNDSEWIETENCTYDRLHILPTNMNSSNITDRSSSEYHRELDMMQSSSYEKLSLPLKQSNTGVNPSLTRMQSDPDRKSSTEFDVMSVENEQICSELTQLDCRRMSLLFVKLLLIMLLLFLLILFGILLSRISHISIIITPLLSYVRGPPPT